MEEFRIEKYYDGYFNQWEEFVKSQCYNNPLLSRKFVAYHEDKFEDFSFLIFNGKKLKAIFLGHREVESVYAHKGLSYGGIFFKKDTGLLSEIEIWTGLLESFNNQGVDQLFWKLIPQFYLENDSKSHSYILHLSRAIRYRSDAYIVIDNAKNKGPNRNRKRALSKAREAGIIIQEGQGIDYFWEYILTKNLQDRFGVNPVHSIKEIKVLMDSFPDRIRFFSVVDKKGEAKAGAVIICSDNVAHYQYSSGIEDRSDNGALDFLFHEINQLFLDKKYVSFGSCSENEGFGINKGLVYWKESFSGHVTTQDFYSLKTSVCMELKKLL